MEISAIEIEIEIGDTICSRGARREPSTTSTANEIHTRPFTAVAMAAGTMIKG
jgi:hypothetical protein